MGDKQKLNRKSTIVHLNKIRGTVSANTKLQTKGTDSIGTDSEDEGLEDMSQDLNKAKSSHFI